MRPSILECIVLIDTNLKQFLMDKFWKMLIFLPTTIIDETTKAKTNKGLKSNNYYCITKNSYLVVVLSFLINVTRILTD